MCHITQDLEISEQTCGKMYGVRGASCGAALCSGRHSPSDAAIVCHLPSKKGFAPSSIHDSACSDASAVNRSSDPEESGFHVILTF